MTSAEPKNRFASCCAHLVNHSCCVFFGLILVGVPVLSFVVIVVTGGILSTLEMKVNPDLQGTLIGNATTEPALVPWTFEDGFYYCAQNVLSFCNPIVGETTNTRQGKIVDVYISVIEVALFGIVVSLVDRYSIPDYFVRLPLRALVPRCCPCFSCSKSYDRTPDLVKLRREFALHSFILILVALPAATFLLCAVAGGLLASAEGWDWNTGIFYTAQNVLGLANPITNPNLAPTTSTGRFNALYFASVALSMTGIVVAAVGGYPTEKDVESRKAAQAGPTHAMNAVAPLPKNESASGGGGSGGASGSDNNGDGTIGTVSTTATDE